MASTETQTARHGGVEGTRPRIGLLGIMQALYDDMLPGITERQAAYAAEVAAALGDDADVTVAPPVKTREDADRALRELEAGVERVQELRGVDQVGAYRAALGVLLSTLPAVKGRDS